MKIVTSGAGAAGIAIIKLLMSMGLKNVIMTDRKGAIYEGREGLNPIKEEMAKITNFNKEKGTLAEVIKGADIFIGVSAPGTLTQDMVRTMANVKTRYLKSSLTKQKQQAQQWYPQDVLITRTR